MTAYIITGVAALLLGFGIGLLLMRLRAAAAMADNARKDDELATLRQRVDDDGRSQQAQQAKLDDMLRQNSALQTESEMKDRQLDTLRQELERHTSEQAALHDRYIGQLEAAGDLKSAAERIGKELEMVRQALAAEQERSAEQAEAVRQRQERVESLQRELADGGTATEGLRKELALLRGQYAELREQAARQETEAKQLAAQLDAQKVLTAQTVSERNTARREVELLKEQMTTDKQERAEALSQQLAMAKEQLQNATQEILKQREESLGKTNSEQMAGVVGPLKEQLEAMQKQVVDNIKSNAENKTSIEEAIRSLMQRTQEISADANNLARALKNESKTQGNWGEMILETLLSNSGLEEGKHYEKQSTLRDAQGKAITHDETGKRLIPDVVVHYPDGKDCVIDSKVSLSDYLDYCKATTDAERDQALARHINSVRKHVKELANKDYASYIKAPRQSMGYTIMFIPNETALQIAMQGDQTLWPQAFERGVCITSEQNLLVLLRMIQMAWTQNQQTQNQQEVFEQARRLLDRVADFVERFDRVGEQVHKVEEAFENARNKLYNGQQSIVKAASDMQKLGAKTSGKRQLPEPSDWRNE